MQPDPAIRLTVTQCTVFTPQYTLGAAHKMRIVDDARLKFFIIPWISSYS